MATNKQSYPNSGALFTHDKKGNERAPDYSGKIEFDASMIAGLKRMLDEGKTPTVYLSGWKKPGRDGNAFLSISAQLPMSERSDAPAPRTTTRRAGDGGPGKGLDDMDSDIPFISSSIGADPLMKKHPKL